MRDLSDPVTVTEERTSESIVRKHEKERRAMIPKPGNLLSMARLNFRVKCNNHSRDSATLGRCLLFMRQTFFYGMRLFI